MLLQLFQSVSSTANLSSILSFYSTRMILAAATSLLICIALGPFYIRKLYELKMGQTIRSKECPLLGELHRKKGNTPTMGGGLILFSMLVSLLLYMDGTNSFTLLLLITTLVLGSLGAVDDFLKIKYRNSKGLPARAKMIIQLLLSLAIAGWLLGPWFIPIEHSSETSKAILTHPIVKEPLLEGGESLQKSISVKEMASRLYLPFLREPLIAFSNGWDLLFVLLLTVFVISGTSNAVNLTDGLDGLAAGCLILVSSCLALIAFVSNHVELASFLQLLYIEGSGEIAIYLSALAGACLGFLWYNGHPAQLFMGDTGSLALGGIIGVSALLLGRALLLALIGAVFVAEALSVILQVASYKICKRRIFLCAPLHHHFEYKGWPESKVVVRFWIIGLLCALLGLASLKLQ